MFGGSFDNHGRPWIQGRLILCRLKVQGAVNFVIDTGASDTVIHPSDGKRLRVPFDKLNNNDVEERRGIGGSSPYYREEAVIAFEGDSVVRYYRTSVLLAKPGDADDGLPSLLGRPLMESWRLLYDPSNRKIEITHQG